MTQVFVDWLARFAYKICNHSLDILKHIEQDFFDISVEFAPLSAFWTSEDPVEFCDFVPQNWWVRRVENDYDVYHPQKIGHYLIQVRIPCHATHIVKVGCFGVQPTLILVHLLLLDEECLADLSSLVNCTVGSWRSQMV